MQAFEQARETMIDAHLKARGITDTRVLDAMAEVPREAFLPAGAADAAYMDAPQPIGRGQTISQPYIVALMTQLMAPGANDRVLDIGTGSGYAAAVLSRIAKVVYSVERHAALADDARNILHRLGYDNIHIRQGDGTLGWPDNGPYDAIGVTAAAPEIPSALKAQLAVGGRLVVPVGSGDHQELLRIRRTDQDAYHQSAHLNVRFVPLVGAQGWR